MLSTLFLQDSFHQWQIVFWILAVTYISAAVVFVIIGTGDLQSWNNPPERVKIGDVAQEEGMPLKNEK